VVPGVLVHIHHEESIGGRARYHPFR
jgi:hypothetical protein